MSDVVQPVDNGSQMKCAICHTQWWTKLAGSRCPSCDPKYARLKSTLRFNLETKTMEKFRLLAQIEAIEEMTAMCDRLDKGL